VLREGGVALVIGPVRPANRLVRRLSETWMLFPSEHEYRTWFERAGFGDVTVRTVAPDWYRGRSPYAVAVAGVKPRPGPPPLPLTAPAEDLAAPMTARDRARFAGRLALGSLAGAAFVPLGAALALRTRLASRTRR
jgi:MPBQ/MSBQ methyltransferase